MRLAVSGAAAVSLLALHLQSLAKQSWITWMPAGRGQRIEQSKIGLQGGPLDQLFLGGETEAEPDLRHWSSLK